MSSLITLLLDESGTTMIENMLSIALIVLPLAYFCNLALEMLKEYFEVMSIVVSIPFP